MKLPGSLWAQKVALILLATITIMALLPTPASATPIPVVIRGTVIGMNESARTLTIQADCERFTCNYKVIGLFVGRVPDGSVFSRIQTGEYVEAVFKEWPVWLDDAKYQVPSKEPQDIRQWYAIQRLAYGDDGKSAVGTELFGDPAYVDTPLDAGYLLDYRLSGPSPAVYDYASFPRETVANISVTKRSGFNRTATLVPGKSSRFSDSDDNSIITIQFIGGYDAGLMAGKACPCADYHIRVLSEKDRVPVAAVNVTRTQEVLETAPAGTLLPALGICAAVLIAGLARRRR